MEIAIGLGVVGATLIAGGLALGQLTLDRINVAMQEVGGDPVVMLARLGVTI